MLKFLVHKQVQFRALHRRELLDVYVSPRTWPVGHRTVTLHLGHLCLLHEELVDLIGGGVVGFGGKFRINKTMLAFGDSST